MIIELKIPDSVKLVERVTLDHKMFLQGQVNRRVVGAMRYSDPPQRGEKYLSWLEKELRAYKQNGNYEHLLNICNLAFLESVEPQNPKFHFDPNAASVRRSQLENA